MENRPEAQISFLRFLLHAHTTLIKGVRKINKGDYQLRDVRPYVHLIARNNSVPTERIFIKSDNRVFFEYMSAKFKFH
jgi:hypothetical protein